ncbi:MAG: 50S ribosomal protein L18 [Candidatus Aenigmarchaeota archaeon]|nr:50S ribosomal protein L18 [Candidatus Aenigmarchaeota archaeon]
MNRGPTYKVPFKRRLEKKTDYRKRLRLLYSKEKRLVVRKSLKHTRAQVIEFDTKGDKSLVSASSQELKKFGWDGPSDNVTSAYLTGLLIGKRTLDKKINSVVLDIGTQRSIKGSKIYAVLKGALDAGLSVPHSPDIFPSEERIKGKHIVDYAEKLKKEDEKSYKKQFSAYNPEKIVEMFEKVKANVLKG